MRRKSNSRWSSSGHKRNTSDDRESPAGIVAGRLVGLGAEVRAADPHVVEGAHLPRRGAGLLLIREVAADIVVLLTDHDAFDLQLVSDAGLVLDTRHRLAAAPNVEFL